MQEDPYRELTPNLRALALSRYDGIAFDIARQKPGTWMAVYVIDTRIAYILAFIGIPRLITWASALIGHRITILEPEPFALMYDATAEMFHAWPLALMPKSAGLPCGPFLLWECILVLLWHSWIIGTWDNIRSFGFGSEPTPERTEHVTT